MGWPCNTGDVTCVNFFFGNYEQKVLLGRPMCKWKDNIKLDLKKYDVRL
jgi:hypothetical protein